MGELAETGDQLPVERAPRATRTAAQTIGILSRMQVVVSMRLHGLIFSASQGVPLVGIVYDQKVSSFLSYIGQDLYEGLDQLTQERLKDLIDQAVSRALTEWLPGREGWTGMVLNAHAQPRTDGDALVYKDACGLGLLQRVS